MFALPTGHQKRVFATNAGEMASPDSIRVRLGLGDRATPFLLDNRPAIFSEHSQKIYELSESAAALVARLESPVALERFYSDIAPMLEGGAAEIDDLLVEWSAQGILDLWSDDPGNEPGAEGAPVLGVRDAGVQLHFSAPDLHQELRAPYAHLQRAAPAGLRAEVHRWRGLGSIKVTGRPAAIVPQAELAPSFRFLLVEALLAASEDVAIHGACVTAGDEAVILLGGPGAGKSTLAMFAGECGFGLAGDDIVMFHPTSGTVRAMPLPLTLKEGTWSRFEEAGAVNADWPADVRKDGVKVRYLPLPRPADAVSRKVRAFVLIDRREEGGPEFRDCSKLDCLRKLCDESRSNSGESSVALVEGLVEAVERADTLHLAYSDAAEAAQALRQRLGG